MTFAASFPAWCTPLGRPLSWRHFVYGMAFLARKHLRDSLALAEGVRMGAAEQKNYKRFADDISRMTEVPRDG